MTEREVEKIEEWLTRYENAVADQLKAAAQIEAAVEEMGTHVENFGGYVRRLRDYS